MTSRIRGLMDDEASWIERRRVLREELEAATKQGPRFAVAMMPDKLSSTERSVPVVFLDARIDEVDPARIVFFASIDPETGVHRLEKYGSKGLPGNTGEAYLEWMAYWYGT